MKRPLITLLLARHGQAETNQQGAFLGRSDLPLTPHGKTQADNLASKLTHWQIDAIYSSSLQRALHTAKAIGQKQNKIPMIDNRLVEQDFGKWEGLVFEQAQDQFPKAYRAWQQNALHHAPTEGETLAQVQARIWPVFEEIKAQRVNQTVLIVAHGCVLNVLICTLLKITPQALWTFQFPTGGMAELWVYQSQTVMARMEA